MKKFFLTLNEFLQKASSRTYFFIFVVIVALGIIGLMQISVEDDTGPCSPTQFFGECYDIPRSLCETTLSVIHRACDGQVKAITTPGKLVGPIVTNCEQLKFDRILKYTRKSHPVCAERINYLESWQKTNPDF